MWLRWSAGYYTSGNGDAVWRERSHWVAQPWNGIARYPYYTLREAQRDMERYVPHD
jgi:hypothetical protein